jgi:hypothetical protein
VDLEVVLMKVGLPLECWKMTKSAGKSLVLIKHKFRVILVVLKILENSIPCQVLHHLARQWTSMVDGFLDILPEDLHGIGVNNAFKGLFKD